MSRLAVLLAAVAACGGSPPVEPNIPLQKKPEPPPVVEWSKLVGPIKTIDVNTPDATLVAKIKDTFAPVIGKPIDRSTLRNSLTIATTLPNVADIDARATQLADGVAMTIDITPQPTLHGLVAREAGGSDLPLPGQLSSAIGLPVDPGLLDALGGQLVDTYLSNGYADASVTWKQTQAGSGSVDVAVEVTPGKPSTISTVDFKGNTHIKKADLLKALNDTFPANTPWTIGRVMHGQLVVETYYYDHGYINVAVEQPRPPGDIAPLIYTITEGDQFHVGKLEFINVQPAESKKFLGTLGFKTGDVFNRSAISAGIEKLNASLKADNR
ncbi:MAG TPA: POTRA domain-containing protein, partial [Kofleriaceae bacterium]